MIRQILNAHSKTGLEWLYIETGKLPLKYLIQIRRLMYLWHILSREKSELIRRIYETQNLSNDSGDWIRLVENDKQELELKMSDEEIQNVSKERFKSFIKSKVKIKFLTEFNNLKKKHSKSKHLDCSRSRTADYLNNTNFNTKQKRLLFKLRSRTLDVKLNFRGQQSNILCISCGLFPESQSHLLQCPQIVTRLNYLNGKTSKLNELDIYGDIESQKRIVNIYSDILEVREKLKNEIK